ncbi:uncharacterized protein CLUP02_08605 [Colletotrichum lupini]|uniref:Uncharacterized protein n=1 Tax=Colletotrichum lupini TaxID=145971 RepID=A0A9Q8ST57_9PEZI|nr:uncharacterized protein CLUP02_08605 [Colletotrichum lupini]UQC83112.1 hypothetical protein CLUP02_08605 [Colletotrichum lupini]
MHLEERLAERDTAGPSARRSLDAANGAQHSHLRKSCSEMVDGSAEGYGGLGRNGRSPSGTAWLQRNRRIDLTESKGRRTRNSNRQATTTFWEESSMQPRSKGREGDNSLAQHSTAQHVKQYPADDIGWVWTAAEQARASLAAGNKCREGNSSRANNKEAVRL